MGHSMGGMIVVQEMTKILGNRVNKLICFATVINRGNTWTI